MDVTGIILAGGRSTRMGRDKALLEIGGETLLQRTVRVVAAVADEILIVGRTGLPGGVETAALPDDTPGVGPIGGLATGLRRMTAERAVVVSCDLPFLCAPLLGLLLRLCEDVDAAVPVVDGRGQPTCAVYGRNCLRAIERHVAGGDYRLRSLLAEIRVRWVEEDEIDRVEGGRRSLVNVNTTAEWKALAGALQKD